MFCAGLREILHIFTLCSPTLFCTESLHFITKPLNEVIATIAHLNGYSGLQQSLKFKHWADEAIRDRLWHLCSLYSTYYTYAYTCAGRSTSQEYVLNQTLTSLFFLLLLPFFMP